MILFITRNYPPSIGGKERHSYELIKGISSIEKTAKITWSKHLKGLWYFMIIAFIKASYLLLIRQRDIELVHLNDPVLSPIGLLLKFITKKPVIANVHGLDIIYPNWLYQKIIPGCLRKMDRVISNSNATALQCIKRGIPSEKIEIIPVGVTINDLVKGKTESYIEKLGNILKLSLKGRKIIITIGRLVKRKGVAFFVSEVLPGLVKEFPDLCYLVIGEGQERTNIEKIIREKKMEAYTFLVGYLDDETISLIKDIASIFVMPNIPVEGDMEGFGMVALEAAVVGLPVVASRLEGISEAIKDGENGILIEPGDAKGYKRAIRELLINQEKRRDLGDKGRNYTISNYSWEVIAKRYFEVFQETVQS